MSDGPAGFAIKPISAEAVARAIEKAEQYRLLNDPALAESICLDVLAADPDNEQNLRVLILALADQLGLGENRASSREARKYVDRLPDEYQRAYYSGLIAEREAWGCLRRGHASVFAYDCFRAAMESYAKAEALRPAGNDDPLLRWNSCVRTIEREKLSPLPEQESEQPLE